VVSQGEKALFADFMDDSSVLSETAVEVCNGGLVSMDSRPVIKD